MIKASCRAILIRFIGGVSCRETQGQERETQGGPAGIFRDHHGFMIQASLDHIASLEKIIADLDRQDQREAERLSS